MKRLADLNPEQSDSRTRDEVTPQKKAERIVCWRAPVRVCVMVQTHLPAQPSGSQIGHTGPSYRPDIRGPLPLAGAACLFFLSFFTFSSGSALAFSPAMSSAEARLRPDRLDLTVKMDLETAWFGMGEPANSVPNIGGSMPRVKKFAAEVFRLSLDGHALAPRQTDVDYREEEGGVVFYLVFSRPAAGDLRFDAPYVARLPSFHQAELAMWDETRKLVGHNMLDAAKPWAVLRVPGAAVASLAPPGAPLPSAPSASLPPRPNVSFWGFVKLGLTHVLTGFDHLLFLCALLVVCGRFSSMVTIVICFVLAHSLTLALAALGVVTVPGRVAEPLIAVSIALVGLGNLVRRGQPRGWWLLTLILGSIHGFGFANVLRRAEPGATGISMIRPLLSFNLGVELGLLAVLAILLPVLWKLRTRPGFVRYGVPAISVVALLLGGYWLLQRTVFI